MGNLYLSLIYIESVCMIPLIQLIDLSLYFPEKICFEAFNYQIKSGERIALTGDNGSGKSCMLKIINKMMLPSDGLVKYNGKPTISYVPQLTHSEIKSSGAEQFNYSLTQALSQNPDILLLDEPTNHLDSKNRHSLFRLLEQFKGALIIASHDVNLLQNNDYCFWHFNHAKIELFEGSFVFFQQQNQLETHALENELEQLHRQKIQSHQALMQEQQRAKSSRLKGEKSIKQAKWPTIVSKSKALRAQLTTGKKQKALHENKAKIVQRLAELNTEDTIKPDFDLTVSAISSKAIVTINDGTVAYDGTIILKNININLYGQKRLAISGANGAGKSTLLKAIIEDTEIHKEGLWIIPAKKDIGYLDQHYRQLNEKITVIETIQECRPDWNHQEIRKHLNKFLFRKNDQVYSLINTLSGGEKARLSLAQIAAVPPKLLIMDELTNNLDLRTRNHVITLLNEYPGPMIIVSHDTDFLEKINLDETYFI